MDETKRWRRRQYTSARRIALRDKAINYLGGSCHICGYSKSPAAFDIHHIDPMTKEFNLSSATSWVKALPELGKCVLLCANCHREVHDGMHPTYLEDGYDHGSHHSEPDDPFPGGDDPF